MPNHVVFVAPFFLETTLRFVAGAARLPGVNLSLISQDPAERLPVDLRHPQSAVVEEALQHIVRLVTVELA